MKRSTVIILAVLVVAMAVIAALFLTGEEKPGRRPAPRRVERKAPAEPARAVEAEPEKAPVELAALTPPAAPAATAEKEAAPPEEREYVSIGLGGGGAMYSPASSPHDPDLMFVSCDMGGFYRSEDGGRHWRMIDFRQTRGSTSCRAVFHPKDPNTVYFKGLVSRDGGRTWAPLAQGAPWGRDVVEMGIGPEGRIILVGTSGGAFISRDGGESWSACEGVKGRAVGLLVEAASDPNSRIVFAGTSENVYRSDDEGRTWAEKCSGLPWREIRSFRGASDEEKTILYCTLSSRKVNDEFGGGVYRSTDRGETWQGVMGDGINTRLGKIDQWGSGDIARYSYLGVSEGHPETVYVVCKGTGYWPPNNDTVYRSDDAGDTWRAVYFDDVRFKELNHEQGWIPRALTWRWGGIGSGFNVNAGDPNVAMITNGGEIHVTTDGGNNWRQAYSEYAPGQEPPAARPGERPGRWQSIGLEVTTTWDYCVDPFDHSRHYICYTDIGFAVSEDAGRTWHHSAKGSPWRNTTYAVVFEPEKKGRIWAAMSNVHDIPHWTFTHDQAKGSGGVCISEDGGVTWTKSSEGLPNAPAVSIVLDPKSPPGSRTLYCALYDHGVFKSADDGKTWRAVSNGIDLEKNSHTWLVKLHPDGTLFCGVTARRVGGRRSHDFPRVGALYRSTNGGQSWEDITTSRPLHWPNEFAVHPKDSRIIYLSAGTIPGGREGGIYKTTDGGESWKRLLRDEDFAGKGGPSYVQGMFVTLDPKDPDTVYLGTDTHGLWVSRDAGGSWEQTRGIPFGNIHRVTFDPDDHETVYVTTFGGGVWRGPRP